MNILFFRIIFTPFWRYRFGMDCSILRAHGFVATHWNRATIQRHCASPYTREIGTRHPTHQRTLG
ncbi:hypothetical protein C8R30_11029 [Nitrosomonas nitrosa]|jgi:hypothetical protein|uniref:Uncharacterized protein n=1 Tax=Nitrosomonas nitrosa TaxID=52442 RepID=A0A1I4QHZ9_9PROT|nr:hypothetical protein C8R30_11029 [Nitrosomonas nitrosa]SFM39644.1 hypothetical protein SAMN05421880_11531 [Nitrosomonas nitrosa]